MSNSTLDVHITIQHLILNNYYTYRYYKNFNLNDTDINVYKLSFRIITGNWFASTSLYLNQSLEEIYRLWARSWHPKLFTSGITKNMGTFIPPKQNYILLELLYTGYGHVYTIQSYVQYYKQKTYFILFLQTKPRWNPSTTFVPLGHFIPLYF